MRLLVQRNLRDSDSGCDTPDRKRHPNKRPIAGTHIATYRLAVFGVEAEDALLLANLPVVGSSYERPVAHPKAPPCLVRRPPCGRDSRTRHASRTSRSRG